MMVFATGGYIDRCEKGSEVCGLWKRQFADADSRDFFVDAD